MAIIKGRTRGGGRQLAHYLLSDKDNEDIRILDVDGQLSFDERDLQHLLTDFSLNEQLSRSKKGIYHAVYNPPEELAARLTDTEWMTAAEVITTAMGFEGQRKAVVLQKNKAGRYHIHIAYERYNHESAKMMAISHNYRKHDRARAILEKTFNDTPTPQRNLRRQEIKKELTEIWQQCSEGGEFIKAARQGGYVIAKGYERGQFVVVDQTGRSFKLVSHLEGVRIKEVRVRLKDKKLIGEKEAVAFVATQKALTVAKPAEQIDERKAFLEKLSQQRNKVQTPKPRMH